jgi:hypothetical protein
MYGKIKIEVERFPAELYVKTFKFIVKKNNYL